MSKTRAPLEVSSTPAVPDDESAVTVLQHLESERGKLFTESDYQEMRNAILEELSHGARLRRFTVFTFTIIALGLAGLLLAGLWSSRDTHDYTLTAVSLAALGGVGYFFWNLRRGIQEDAFRSLDARLRELKQLRQHRLVSEEEFFAIEAHILMARQQHPAR